MKHIYAIIVAGSILGVVASPNFVTPSMMKRNGLTDEQYQQLWAQGKNPKITQAAARDWIFRAHRFANVTNWLEVIGRTNDYARLVYPTITTNEMLTATNRVLAGEVDYLTGTVGRLQDRLAVAETDAEIYRAIQKSAKRTKKNLDKIVKEIEKAKKKAQTEDEIALYNALLAAIRGQSPNTEEE